MIIQKNGRIEEDDERESIVGLEWIDIFLPAQLSSLLKALVSTKWSSVGPRCYVQSVSTKTELLLRRRESFFSVFILASNMQIHLIFLCFVLIAFNTVANSKHHPRKFTCPVLRKCPVHKHKICGSDGKLYNSHCHLRKAACEKGIPLRAFHPDQCESTDESNNSAENLDPGSTNLECDLKQYESMKEQLLLKVNDVSLLFTQLDENSDGSININELWRKSATFRPDGNSPCLLTDLLQHEDGNDDDFLDFTEFQNAFNKLYTITMVTLEQSLAVNTIQAHIGDNVEIRCDIVGKPQQPTIKWFRHYVDLTTVSVSNIKVFSDGSLYLTNVQLSFAGNYTCQAENNPIIKQTHVLHVIVPPVVDVSPHFQWSAVGGLATVDCRYESLDGEVDVKWLKNDEQINANEKITIMRNGSRVEIGQLTRSDTGAYACRVQNKGDSALGQDIASILVQDEPVGSSPESGSKQRLWVFHGNGVSVYSAGCGGLLHEVDARDIIPQNGLALCGGAATGVKQSGLYCTWSENAVVSDLKIYIGQPNLNRIIVFHTQQLNVVQVIATDPRPKQLWLVKGQTEDRIWVLCHGEDDFERKQREKNRYSKFEDSETLAADSLSVASASAAASSAPSDVNQDFEWNSPSQDQKRHNKKTVQVVRLLPNARTQNVIHLQPIDGHFDLVYDLFVPKPSPLQKYHFHNNNKYAYVTHWDERALIKIDMEQYKYIKTINLAECQPINAVFTEYGLLIVQCQTPVTHQLNGQLILDQITDTIISYNAHIKSHRSYLSPNQHFLVNIYHNSSSMSPISTTIIVQRVTQSGLQFLYDVRTTLTIVNCQFVWKNGNYDAILASGTVNREDLLYLSLIDGRVELISGIGRPTKGHLRGMAVDPSTNLGAITSLESVFILDLNSNRVLCETQQRHQQPETLIWT